MRCAAARYGVKAVTWRTGTRKKNSFSADAGRDRRPVRGQVPLQAGDGRAANIQAAASSEALDALVANIRACRICRATPKDRPLAHEPRPVVQVDVRARLAIAGQAPGTRVHTSGRPFTDPSGDRLRAWMGIGPEVFYDSSRVAIVPMGFCFPGLDAKGGDLPPRPECALTWRARIFEQLPNVELLLLVGQYAQRWHLSASRERGATLTETVKAWRGIIAQERTPRLLPLPHPSWRNNAWLKANPWFEEDLLPVLRAQVKRLMA
jgi:uracil-DNA glycosylase